MPKVHKSPADVFQRVNSRSLHKLKKFKAEDSTNLTHSYRHSTEYKELLCLEKPLETIIANLSITMGKKISVLDAGCGECVAINDLLSNPLLNDAIQHISGASLHYFRNAKLVAEKHTKRFDLYLGKVQDVLSKSHEKYDLIIDAWGAFSYSSNKFDLLKQYHNALNPGGVAYIYVGKKLLISDKKKNIDFFEWAVKNHPETCALTSSSCKYSITLTKSTLRYPLSNSAVISSREIPTLTRGSEYSFFTLKQGNAIAISEVIDEPIASRLRSLPC